jgi:hypothetical protein
MKTRGKWNNSDNSNNPPTICRVYDKLWQYGHPMMAGVYLADPDIEPEPQLAAVAALMTGLVLARVIIKGRYAWESDHAND